VKVSASVAWLVRHVVNLLNDRDNCGRCTNACKDLLGFPLPCLFGICAGMKFDMGTDM
jgi:hypothetical protein